MEVHMFKTILIALLVLITSFSPLFALEMVDEAPIPKTDTRELEIVPFSLSFFPKISIPEYQESKRTLVHFHYGFLGVYQDNQVGITMTPGLINITKEKMNGFQSSAILSYAGDAEGFQGSGVGNIVYGDFDGFQGAGTFNLVYGIGNGFQASSILNLVRGSYNGFQASGLLNINRSFSGAQFGLVNINGTFNGCSFGLVNYAEKSEGPMFGLVNIRKDGFFQIDVIGTEIGNIQLEVLHGKDYFYNLYTSGYVFGMNKRSFGLGIGSRWKVSERLKFGVEATSELLGEPMKDWDEEMKPHNEWSQQDFQEFGERLMEETTTLFRAKLFVTYNIKKHFGLKAGISYNSSFSMNGKNNPDNLLGYEFPWSGTRGKAWPGFFLGITI